MNTAEMIVTEMKATTLNPETSKRPQMHRNISDTVLIVGTIPPPTGGVTIHVSRFLKHLEAREIPYTFCGISEGPVKILRQVMKHKVIHLHASNSYFRLAFSIVCFLSGKKLIQTIHGDLGRFSRMRNLCDRVAVRLSHTPVVINKGSLEKAGKLNRRSVLISAFIKPINSEPLPDEILDGLKQWKNGLSHIFCANATSPDRDTLGREIYGGSELMKVFSRQPEKGLIFVDPGGHYREIIRGNGRSREDESISESESDRVSGGTSEKGRINENENLPRNVFYINRPLPFFEILKFSDCYIRATTTDGDSLSVKEALSIGKPVIASDCVDRPEECTLYKTADTGALLQQVAQFSGNGHPPDPTRKNAFKEEVDKIIALYAN